MIHNARALLTPFSRISGRMGRRGDQLLTPPKNIFSHRVRCHSNKGSEVNGSADGIIDAAAATNEWKRNHYQKIEDKFSNNNLSSTDTQQLEPLNIDNYDDVQPMWKEMESRVTRRRSLTLEQLKQRGGVSGRQNIRKSEEDYWVQAGVYGDDKKDC